MQTLFKKIFQRTPFTRMIFFITADIVLISFSIWLAFLLRFDGQIPLKYGNTIQMVIILALVFLIPTFYFLRLYSFSWSYVSTNELISLVKGTTFGFLFLGIALYISKDFPFFTGFPRSTLFISYFLVLSFSGGIRFSKRIYLKIFQKGVEGERERTLIVGAGDAGEQILRSIQNSSQSPYLPVGFIDDDIFKQGNSIHGIKVLAGIKDIPEIVQNHRIERMIVALPAVESSVVKKAVEMGRKSGIQKIKILPPLSEIVSGEISLSDVLEFQEEDLLKREQVVQDVAKIKKFIKEKIILITGAAGSIGSELSRQVAQFNPSFLLLLDQDETGIFHISEELKGKFPKLKISSLVADIQDKKKIEQIFHNFHPHIVCHAAAYKHVPLMEEHADEAVKNNIFGTKIIAENALKYGAEKFIFISTDKAVNPASVMGATKRIGEMLCQILNEKDSTKFISVRFGNVLGSRGSVIPIFKEQIKKRDPVEITHPQMRRYFMTTPEAVLLVMQAGEIGQGGEVFVLDMGNPIRILDLAKELIRLSGLEPDKDIPIIYSKPRPGEKFFEDILTAEEGTVATKDQKIFKARLSEIDGKKLYAQVEKLQTAVSNPSKEEIKNIFKELIPSYKPDIP